MELLGVRFPPQSSSFTNSVMKIEQPDKSNAQNFTDQTNSPIVQMDNPNPFSIPMKESNSPAPVAFFPGDFNHQQQPSSSSTSGATSTDTPIQQGHVCQVCNKGFSERSQLKKHESAHRPRSRICSVCGLGFAREDKLRRHFRSLHSNERPFVCESCGKGFARKDKLQEHMRLHNRNLTFPCHVCNQVFHMRSHLNKHLREIHQIKQSNGSSKSNNSTNGLQESSKRKQSKKQQDSSFSTSATAVSLGASIPVAAAAAAAATTPGFYQQAGLNAANLLFYNRYQQYQQQSGQPAFDFWGGNNGYFYGQQYSPAAYQFPAIQYATAMRQQQQCQQQIPDAHSQQQGVVAPPGFSYNPATAAALTARLFPNPYFWTQPHQGLVLPQAAANGSVTPGISTSTYPYFPQTSNSATVSQAITSTTDAVSTASDQVQQSQAICGANYRSSLPSSTAASSSYQNIYYQQPVSLPNSDAHSNPSQQNSTDIGSGFPYTV